MIFDVLIIGGGVSGMQCALVLGSGLHKPFAKDKKVGIILLPNVPEGNPNTLLNKAFCR